MHRSLFVLLPLLVLSACGKESPAADASAWPSFEQAQAQPPAESPLPAACSLLSAEQASTVLGSEASLMTEEPEACMYGSSAGVGNITMLTLIVGDNEDLAMAQAVFNGIAGQPGNLAGTVNSRIGEKTKKSGQDLDALGDEAWLSAASFGASFGSHQVGAQQLVLRKGTRVLTLNVTGTDKLQGLAQRLETLARSAVAQL